MSKFLQKFMLATIVVSQCAPLVSSVNYYASEVKTASSSEVLETSVETTSESTGSENSELESVETSEGTNSEVVSEATTDTTSEANTTVSEATSATSEETTEVVTASSSELKVSETEASVSETEASEASEADGEITATLKINETGAVTSKAKSARANTDAVVELDDEENLTTYENTERIEAGSGESTISITPTSKSKTSASAIKDEEVYYSLDEDGNLSAGSTKQPRKYEGNLLTVYNGTIVEADNAIARTTGGYDYSFYAYPSVDDLQSNTDGVPLSGGGFDATYVETVEDDGNYYYHIRISGYDGYVASENMQIIPEELMSARTYYTVEDGDWVYYSAIDPLTSTEYDRMAIGVAPTSAEVGVKYYSDDDVNYYTDDLLQDTATQSVAYNSYFQNLPFRSESSYTASNFKSYLNAKGKTSSEYYNETSAFTKVQTKESINSLLMFSMANHESAYGTSTYARACYNFFGRGAVDSDPDQACQYYSYPTATDGILAQALFLQNGYFDVLDWRYSGTHVGNKASGMNVKYASDTDWGKKISNHAYMTDQYLGGKEEDKYAIAQVTGVKHVYTTKTLSTKVRSSGDSGTYSYYDLSQMAGTSNTVNVVALQQDKDNNSYQIYVPTSVKTSSSQDCSYTNSKKGSYPNYGGRTKVNVNNNTANYSCDYGDYPNGKFWISKSNTKIISDKSVPATTKYYYSYWPNGKVKNKYFVNGSTNAINYTYQYDQNTGKIVKKYTYFSGTKYGNHTGKIYTIYDLKDGYVKQATRYNTSQQITNIYRYYNDATLYTYQRRLQYRFDIQASTGYITKAHKYESGSANRHYVTYVYQPKTKYGNHGNRKSQVVYLKPGTNVLNKIYKYNSKQQVEIVYTYKTGTEYNGNQGNHRHNLFFLKGSNMEIDYAINYDSSNKPNVKYTYAKGTKYTDNYGDKITHRYYY